MSDCIQGAADVFTYDSSLTIHTNPTLINFLPFNTQDKISQTAACIIRTSKYCLTNFGRIKFYVFILNEYNNVIYHRYRVLTRH